MAVFNNHSNYDYRFNIFPITVKVKPQMFKDEIKIGTKGILPIEFLAKEWSLRKSDILIERGLISRVKKVLF